MIWLPEKDCLKSKGCIWKVGNDPSTPSNSLSYGVILSYSMILTRKVTNLVQKTFCISHNMMCPALRYVFRNLEVRMYQDMKYWLQTQDLKEKRGQEKRSYSNTSQHVSGLNVKKGGGEALQGIIGQGIWLWHPGLTSLRKRDIAHFISSLSLEEAEGTM